MNEKFKAWWERKSLGKKALWIIGTIFGAFVLAVGITGAISGPSPTEEPSAAPVALSTVTPEPSLPTATASASAPKAVATPIKTDDPTEVAFNTRVAITDLCQQWGNETYPYGFKINGFTLSFLKTKAASGKRGIVLFSSVNVTNEYNATIKGARFICRTEGKGDNRHVVNPLVRVN